MVELAVLENVLAKSPFAVVQLLVSTVENNVLGIDVIGVLEKVPLNTFDILVQLAVLNVENKSLGMVVIGVLANALAYRPPGILCSSVSRFEI